MKKRISLYIIGIFLSCVSYAQQRSISVQCSFEKDTTMVLFDSKSQVSKLTVNMSVTKKTPKFFVRAILEDQNHRNYLIGETYKELAVEDDTFLMNCADETECLKGVVPYRLKIYVKDASVELKTIDYINGVPTKGNNTDENKIRKLQSKIDKINAYNNTHERLWTAGITELSKMPFEDKMRALGFDESDNTGGFEYYIGGIFEVGERDDYTQVPSRTNTFVDEFDWTNRHGKNWMTSIKGQGYSNYCVAFTELACVEALVNLYYNQKIDLDLSELEAANCCGAKKNPYTNGLTDRRVADYLRDYGVCDEESYRFEDNPNDTLCRSDSITPLINVKINNYWEGNYQYSNEDSIKKLLIRHGPVVSGFWVAHDSTTNSGRAHAMALVGYGTIHAGDSIREIIGSGDSSTYSSYYRIPEGSPLIGRTFFKFKNSNNIRVNDDIDGYMYLLFHNMFQMSYPLCILYPFTITDCLTNLPMYTDNDVVCEDADGDGYYFWGFGPKPATITGEPDGDDSDPNYGTMDDFGNLTPLTSDLYLYGNYVYNRDLNMHRNIIVPSGSTLRIKGNLTLCDDKQIYVYGGGILIVDGGVIDNALINLSNNSTLNILNGGIINMHQNQNFVAPVGAIVNISEGQVNNN